MRCFRQQVERSGKAGHRFPNTNTTRTDREEHWSQGQFQLCKHVQPVGEGEGEGGAELLLSNQTCKAVAASKDLDNYFFQSDIIFFGRGGG